MASVSLLQELTRELRGMQSRGVRGVPLSEANIQAMRMAAARPFASRTMPIGSRPAAVVQPIASASYTSQRPVQPVANVQKPAVPQAQPAVSQPAVAPAKRESRVPALDTVKGWEDLAAACAACEACQQHGARQWEYGTRHAKVMFVGDYPHGEVPLPETAYGTMLVNMGKAMHLQWDGESEAGAYATDVVKCCHSQRPTEEEVASCLPFLKKQIELVSPAVLVLLGQLPVKALLQSTKPFLQVQDTWQEYQGIPVMIIQHPIQILRFENQKAFFIQEKRKAWNSLQQVMKKLSL